MEGAELVLDDGPAIEELLLEYGYLAEEAAQLYTAEVKALLVASSDPSAPGTAPHSEGPLRDSFYSTRARRRRGHPNEVVAYTASDLAVGKGIPLAALLDTGWEDGAARPFLDQAEVNAARRVDALVAGASAR